jgi:hypothetical protein
MIVEDVRHLAVDDDTWELSARVRSGRPRADDRLWFRVTGAPPPPGPADASPFLTVLLLVAMRAGEPLDVDGPVSPLLLDRIPAAQRFYRNWYLGRIDETKVTATPAAPEPGEARSSMCFTAGIDSWFSYLEWDRNPPIDTFVWIPSMYRRLGADAVDRRRAELAGLGARLGARLVCVATNLFDFVVPVIGRRRIFGPALAAAGSTVGLAQHLIASSSTPNALELWNTHPFLDPLWSTERTEIVHTGDDAERIEKLATLAAAGVDWATVHVCHEEAANCGRCEKCLRTMLGLHAAGVDPAVAFDRPLTPAAVARTRVPTGQLWYWREIEAILGRPRGVSDRRLLAAVRTALLRADLTRARRDARRWLTSVRAAVGAG